MNGLERESDRKEEKRERGGVARAEAVERGFGELSAFWADFRPWAWDIICSVNCQAKKY